MMRANRTALVIAALMCAASIGAVVARPDAKARSQEPKFSLEAIIPKRFGDWREEPQFAAQIINPQTQAYLDTFYAEVLSRIYVNAHEYRIMLSVAHGSDQRGRMWAHDPEICYVSQGFTLRGKDTTRLGTLFGEIPVRRLFMSKGPRQEPVTFWWMIGDRAMSGWESRLLELGYVLTGRVPHKLIFRVSSIDPDRDRAKRMQDQFIKQLLQAVPPAERERLTGLKDS